MSKTTAIAHPIHEQLRTIAKDSGKGAALVEIRQKIGLSQREANEIAWNRIIWNQIAGGLILMGLERDQGERHDLTLDHDGPKSKYETAIGSANINRTTAKRWQTMAWAAACSGKLVEDDPVRAANAAGRSLWYTRLVMERLTFDQLEAAIDPSAAKSFRKIEQGVPQRAPDLGAVGRE